MVCQNCGQSNESGQNYCRHCGAPLVQPQRQSNLPPQPKPYGWASPSSPLHSVADGETASPPQRVQPLTPPDYRPPQFPSAPSSQAVSQTFNNYRCPRCGTNAPPIIQSKISDGGWIVFVLMLIFCFPLFFIGLLMREHTSVCSACLHRLG